MGIPVTSLSELDAAKVQQSQLLLTELLQENQPSLEVRRGMIHDLVLYNEAIYAQKGTVELERFRASQSLVQIEADPDNADVEMVDDILSNFRVTRSGGTTAAGSILIVLDRNASLTVPAGMVFNAQGVRFLTATSFAAKTVAGSVIIATDRLLTQIDETTYGFVIEVAGEAEGSAYRLRKDAVLVPETPLSFFVKAYALEDFTGGVDTESNKTLVKRLTDGIAAKALSGRDHMTASLRDQAAFADIVDDSIIGFGDAEMLRDQHTIWPGSVGGGRVDWYVRTQELPQAQLLTKTATLIEKTSDGFGIWQASFERDEAPGFYKATKIVPTGQIALGSFLITSDVRGLDLTALDNDGFLPDIVTTEEAAYSRFQTAVIQFAETVTATHDLALGDTQEYDFTIEAMPLLAEIQDYAAGRRVRNYGGDVLVKAPIPCYMTIEVLISVKPGQAAPSVTSIQAAVAQTVNRYGFTGQLPSSVILNTIYDYLESGTTVRRINMVGRVRKPDGTTQLYNDRELLELVDDAALMVSGRTTAFILDPDDVFVSLEPLSLPEV